ncbi:MAG: Ig-like domain-containing protein [Ilumatobacteraceae bacterium]
MTLATSPALRSSYIVVDEAGKASSPGTVTVTVTKCDAVAPKLVDDNFAVGRNQTLKENFFDNDSAHDGTLTTSSLAGLTVDASAGSFTYNGLDRRKLHVQVLGRQRLRCSQRCQGHDHRQPGAGRQPDSATVDAGKKVTIDVLANDSDRDGDNISIIGTPSASPGSVAVSGGKLVYTAPDGAATAATINYRISDGELDAATTAR